jgi:hypothetical protein
MGKVKPARFFKRCNNLKIVVLCAKNYAGLPVTAFLIPYLNAKARYTDKEGKSRLCLTVG